MNPKCYSSEKPRNIIKVSNTFFARPGRTSCGGIAAFFLYRRRPSISSFLIRNGRSKKLKTR